jgi:ketosteroid isomerase-like protein
MNHRLLFTAVLTFAAQSGVAAEPMQPVAMTVHSVRTAETVGRAERAVTSYISAWVARDAERLSRVMTNDAVVDFALDEPGTYLTVDAAALINDCASCTPRMDSGARIANLRVYPTHDPNAVFVQYETISDSAGRTENQLALVELKGERIAHVRNFSAPPVEVVVKNTPRPTESELIRPADRRLETARR